LICINGGSQRAQEPRVNFFLQEKERLARKIADYIASNALSNRFDELILVVPPQFCSETRDALDKQVASRVIREAAKDLMKLLAPQLAAQIRPLVRSNRQL
jgi:protein required for attachment to host cells